MVGDSESCVLRDCADLSIEIMKREKATHERKKKGPPESISSLSVVRPRSSPTSFRVLFVSAVGKKNLASVAKLIRTASKLKCEVMLFHYDGALDWYRKVLPNYDVRVSYSANFSSWKAAYIHQAFISDRQLQIEVLEKFTHIWILDDDIIFPATSEVAWFLADIQRHQPLIAQPTIEGSWQRLVLPSYPHHGCAVRQSDFVEIMAPIMRTDILIDLYQSIYDPTRYSDFGLDRVWCNYVARRYDRLRACMILPQVFFKGTRSGGVSGFAKSKHSYSIDKALWDNKCFYDRYGRTLWNKITFTRCVSTFVQEGVPQRCQSHVTGDCKSYGPHIPKRLRYRNLPKPDYQRVLMDSNATQWLNGKPLSEFS